MTLVQKKPRTWARLTEKPLILFNEEILLILNTASATREIFLRLSKSIYQLQGIAALYFGTVWTEVSHFLFQLWLTLFPNALCILNLHYGCFCLPFGHPWNCRSPKLGWTAQTQDEGTVQPRKLSPKPGQTKPLAKGKTGKRSSQERGEKQQFLSDPSRGNLPCQQDVQEWKLCICFCSGPCPQQTSARLQGDRSTQTVPPSAPYRTMAGNPALGWDRDTAHTILTPQTDSFTPWGCSLWDTPHSSRGEFITKDHARGKQLVRSVLTTILPSSFWLKKKQCPCLKWELNTSFCLEITLIYLG